MANRTTIIGLIIGLVLVLLVGGGIGLFFYLGQKGDISTTSTTSDDGFATLSANFYTSSGIAPTGGTAQALIGSGRTNKKDYVSFSMTTSNTGTVGLTSITIINPNTNLGNSFANVAPLASLATGQSNIPVGSTESACTANAECGAKENCCLVSGQTVTGCGSVGAGGKCLIPLNQYATSGATPVSTDFTASLQGGYQDALGSAKTITSSPVTLNYLVSADVCTDNTPINTCVSIGTLNTNNFCKFTEGTAPQIISDCRGANGVLGGGDDCGCASGSTCQSTGLCTVNTCVDGTQVNQFSTATGSYSVQLPSGTATHPLSSGYVTTSGTGNYTRVYCTSSQVLQAQCNGAKTEFGNVNAAGVCNAPNKATLPATACNPVLGDPSICVYQNPAPGLSGGITGT